MKIIRLFLTLCLLSSVEGVFAATAPVAALQTAVSAPGRVDVDGGGGAAAPAPHSQDTRTPRAGAAQAAVALAAASLATRTPHHNNNDDGSGLLGGLIRGFGSTPGGIVIGEATKIWNQEVLPGENAFFQKSTGITFLFASFLAMKMIDTANPTFTGIKEFFLELIPGRKIPSYKVVPRIKIFARSVDQMLKQFIDSESLRLLAVGGTKVNVESLREGSAQIDEPEKPLDKLLATRSATKNFDEVRRMFFEQMALIIKQLEVFVLKNTPKEDFNYVQSLIEQIRENIKTANTIIEQKVDFRGFLDKDTKIELATLQVSLEQLFTLLVGVFGGEQKTSDSYYGYSGARDKERW